MNVWARMTSKVVQANKGQEIRVIVPLVRATAEEFASVLGKNYFIARVG